ncbi:hypothetical protein CLAFUW4_14844 [Fulvia fulva]|nr:hypothetical protein CLAFUR0_14837 [Fulvia fulva]WPV23007.1 hypothetical protein CLAFUW4_14844 [Fulvia fulva]WPV37958.1 hypothetical protein CLAFUW7_14845 [Fulvia fulva]
MSAPIPSSTTSAALRDVMKQRQQLVFSLVDSLVWEAWPCEQAASLLDGPHEQMWKREVIMAGQRLTELLESLKEAAGIKIDAEEDEEPHNDASTDGPEDGDRRRRVTEEHAGVVKEEKSTDEADRTPTITLRGKAR